MSERIGAVVQARMSSARFPGKMLVDLAGRPALDWLLERLGHCTSLDAVVVATSDDPSDEPLAAFCARRGTPCHRGPLHDVAARVLGAAQDHRLEAVVRVNGDSPLLDQRLVDHAVALMRHGKADLVTNVRPRTFPPGQSVEVFRVDALAAVHGSIADPHELEHVTGPLYAGGFSVLRFAADPPRTATAFTLDTPADHARLQALLGRLGDRHWEYGWEEVLAIS